MNIVQLKTALNFMKDDNAWRFESNSDNKNFKTRSLNLKNDTKDVTLSFQIDHEYHIENLENLPNEPINETRGITYTPHQLISLFVNEPNQVDWFNDDETLKNREFMERNIIHQVTAHPEFIHYVTSNHCAINNDNKISHINEGHVVTTYQIKRIYDSLRVAKPAITTIEN